MNPFETRDPHTNGADRERVIEAMLAIPNERVVAAVRELVWVLYQQTLGYAGTMPTADSEAYREWLHRVRAFEQQVARVLFEHVGGLG